MSKFALLAAITATTILGFSTQVVADVEECEDAASQYQSARENVEQALEEYQDCVRNSEGRDDCSTEKDALQEAQEELESAQSEYESECNN